MSYSSTGRRPQFSSSFGSRSSGFARRGQSGRGGQTRVPRPQYIDPSRYVSHPALVQQVAEAPIAIQHASFSEFGLEPELIENIRLHGYTIPTPIQDQALPYLLQERDLVGIANTGTGKTAAFLLPLIQKILKDHNEGVLIVVPTRELALQIGDEFCAFTRGMRVGMVTCVGGLSINPQIELLRRNPHFVIGTPGRLKDLLNRNSLDLSKYANVVLDEVDRMLDIGFLQDIRFLISRMPQVRHSYFFSATMNREVEVIMQTFLKNPVTVSVRTKELQAHIEQDVIRLKPGMNKMNVLCDLLAQPGFGKVIVFGRTKHGIDALEKVLLARGLQISTIHGNKSQNARRRALDLFKQGRTQALLATDIAARGIDIPDVTHVINYDEPNTFEDYTHRIGRTGRAGKNGKVLTFVM